MPSDSIRYQTAYLHVAELLQALQAGDATATGTLLENATLDSATCGGVGEAFSRVGPRIRRIARSDGGTSMALFLDRIEVADSGTTQVVTADLVLLSATSSVPVRRSVTLVLDPGRAVWTREGGLLKALCSL